MGNRQTCCNGSAEEARAAVGSVTVAPKNSWEKSPLAAGYESLEAGSSARAVEKSGPEGIGCYGCCVRCARCLLCGCVCTLVWLILVLALAVAIFLLLMGSPPLPSFPTERAKKPPSQVHFFHLDKAATVMPLAPASYPDALQGMIWLDTFSAYGKSDVGQGYEDGLLSFGDTDFDELDKETRTQYVSTTGPAWMWFNNVRGYSNYDDAGRGSYLFAWNEDYTEARIWPTFHEDNRNWFGIGPRPHNLAFLLIHFSMIRQTIDPASCPPPAGASKDERNKCAKFIRRSCFLNCAGSSMGWNKPFDYPVFEVVDKDGKHIEPYWSAFLEFAKGRVEPNATAAEEYGITLTEMGEEKDTAFRAVWTHLEA